MDDEFHVLGWYGVAEWGQTIQVEQERCEDRRTTEAAAWERE
jgi:hypothetical protein